MDVKPAGRLSRFGNPQLLFVVDEDVRDQVFRTRWSSTRYGYLESFEPGTKQRLWLHRFVWFLKHGWCPKIIDHINGVRWDCRIENLRPATSSLNSRNRRVRRQHDLPRGVCVRAGKWAQARKRFYARIRINGKLVTLGYYESASLASEAYEAECKRVSEIESQQAKQEAVSC